MTARLRTEFHEVAIGIGWTDDINGNVAGVTQLFKSLAGTWTLTRTVADGVTCITASGDGWDRTYAKPPTPPIPGARVMGFSPVAQRLGRLQSSRPQGFAGEGHAENHAHYQGLRNKQNGDCCNDKDCRPTQARLNNATGLWEAMVDGQWKSVDNPNLVLDDAFLAAQHHPRWDTQAHICASPAQPWGKYTIYCLIPPGSGQ